MMDISLFISIAAFLLSLVTIYFQWFRVKGAKIKLLNALYFQRCIAHPYSGLPKNIQDDFPFYIEQWPGCALVNLVFANVGDRTGLVNIISIDIHGDHGLFEKSYYEYILIPPLEIVEKSILLRNIPIADATRSTIIEINLNLTWGGSHSRNGNYVVKGSIQESLEVELIPRNEKSFPTI